MATLMSYVEHLSETIGPRPATSGAEARAAEYLRDIFESRGLETETQSFDTPTTYAWAYVIYHALTIAAAVASRWFPVPSFLVALVVAVMMRLDLDTRWGLTALMPKKLSQNVIARHEPKVGRGERAARVVVVAHYDSARASLAFSPSMVRNFEATFGLMKACTIAVPVLIFVRLLPFMNGLEPYAWYVTLVPAAYLLIPLVINIHRELFMRFTPGANDNASGVAAMLGVLERLVPEPDAATFVAREKAKMRTEQEAFDADVVPAGALLSYSPAETPQARLDTWTDDDVSWDTGVVSRGQTQIGLEGRSASPGTPEEPALSTGNVVVPDSEQSARLFGTGPLAPRPSAPESRPAPPRWDEDDEAAAGRLADTGPLVDVDDDLFTARAEDRSPEHEPPVQAPPRSMEIPRKRGLFGRTSAKGDRHGVRDWLGVGDDFEPRKAGKDIGSWDALSDDEDDDESGWKGGTAAIEGLEDPDFAANEAARIRRRVTTQFDRELVEKEVWFVATGAEEVGTVGMKALLKEFGPDLQDAVIINLDNLGSGALCYVTREGMGRRVYADRRLVGAAKRAAREAELPVKGCEYRGLSTDATPALVRGFRAMSVMAFDINGRLPNWHWDTDTADEVDPRNLETAVEFVTSVIRTL